MFCTNCGKSILDGSQFCIYCGKKVQNNTMEVEKRSSDIPWKNLYSPESGTGGQYGSSDSDLGKGTHRKKRKKWPVFLVIIMVLVTASAIVFLFMDQRKDGNPSNFSEKDDNFQAQTQAIQFHEDTEFSRDTFVDNNEENNIGSESTLPENKFQTETMIIGDAEEKHVQDVPIVNEVALKDVKGDIGTDYRFVEKITDSYGRDHWDALEINASYNGMVSYLLNGNYDQFTGSIVLSKDAASEADLNLGIFADGVLVYELKGMTKQKDEQSFDLDISGVYQLDIKANNNNGYTENIYIIKGNMIEAQEKEQCKSYGRLKNLVVVDSSEANLSEELFSDSYGNLHDGRLELNAYGNGYHLFNLNQEYTNFSAQIVTGSRTANNAVMNIQCYVDDELVAEFNDISKVSESISVNLDVTGGKTLKIVSSASQRAYTNDTLCYIVDDKLTKD